MSDDRDEPESALLMAAVEAERARDGLPDDVRRRLRARLLAGAPPGPQDTLGSHGDGSASPAPPGAGSSAGAVPGAAGHVAAKLWGALAVGLLIGAGAGSLVTRAVIGERHGEEPPPAAPAVVSSEPPSTPPAAPRVAPARDAEVEEPSPARAPSVEAPPAEATPAPRRAARPTLADREEERTLIELARAALARGNDDAAMDALARHARRFPRGALAEEREGLRIIALARRDPERAGAAADRFARRHPESVLLPAIRRALQEREAAHDDARGE